MHKRFKPWVRPWMIWAMYPFLFARHLKLAARYAAEGIRDWIRTGRVP